MPIYTIENTKTGETEDVMMPYDNFEKLLKKNKHLKHIIKPCGIADPTNINISKVPADFSKHVLGRIKEQHPHGSVEKRWQVTKEI